MYLVYEFHCKLPIGICFMVKIEWRSLQKQKQQIRRVNNGLCDQQLGTRVNVWQQMSHKTEDVWIVCPKAKNETIILRRLISTYISIIHINQRFRVTMTMLCCTDQSSYWWLIQHTCIFTTVSIITTSDYH